MSEEITDAIAANAAKPKKAESDGESVEQHSLPDMIAADQHLRSQSAASRKNRGLRFSKIEPPGA